MKKLTEEDFLRQAAWDEADWLTKAFWCLLFVIGPLVLIGFVVTMLVIEVLP